MKKSLKIFIAVAASATLSLFITAAVNPDFKITKNMEILVNIFRELNMNYVDGVDPDKLMQQAAEGMTKNIDPYTEYLSEEVMKGFQIMTTGKYGGIGALVKKGKDADYAAIAQPYRGKPADVAGLKIDDKIIAIDGVNMKGLDLEKITIQMKGDPGTVLKMTIESEATGERREVQIKRERIAISGVPYYGVLKDSVGYIALDNFTENCSADVKAALLELKKQNIKSLILDIRSNGGGIMGEAVNIVGLFVPKGTQVVSTIGKNKQREDRVATTNDPVDTKIKLAVMINSASASASEIVSGALQDLDRAVVIGERSFGKGLVQTTRPVGYNSYLKLTIAKYYIPSGRCIQAINYGKRAADGSIAHIPDSLINEFKTVKGRKVYDGGGIMPDVRVTTPDPSIFTVSLYSQNYIDEFAREYFKKNPKRVAEGPNKFKLTDAEYNGFVEFMKDKTVAYESKTDAAVKQLRSIAEGEKQLDQIQKQLVELETMIKNNKSTNLMRFKPELIKLIENDILIRKFYTEGVIRHNLPTDTEIMKAVSVLSDPKEYQKVTSKDTDRK